MKLGSDSVVSIIMDFFIIYFFIAIYFGEFGISVSSLLIKKYILINHFISHYTLKVK